MPGKAAPNKPQTMVIYCFSTTDIFSGFWKKKVENTFCISQTFRNSNCELNNSCLVRDTSCQCNIYCKLEINKIQRRTVSSSKSYSTSIYCQQPNIKVGNLTCEKRSNSQCSPVFVAATFMELREREKCHRCVSFTSSDYPQVVR